MFTNKTPASFISSVFNMKADVYIQQNTQDKDTGAIKREWVYNKTVLCKAEPVKMRGITGGGLLENIPRVLPEGLAAHLVKGSWPQTELFAWLQNTAGIDDIEMNRTFNNGIGMVVVVHPADAQACAATLRAAGEQVYVIGAIAPQGDGAQVIVA